MAEKDLEWRFWAERWTDVRESEGNLAYRYKAVTDSYPYECRGEDGKAVKFWRAEKRIAMFSLSLRKKQCIEIARPSGLREHGGCDTGPFPDLLHGGPAGMPVGEEGLPRQVHGGGDPGLLA